jgi:hemerythrin-like metal-binding protein/PAS domain S-box-containing protein
MNGCSNKFQEKCSILNLVPEGILIVNKKFEVLFWNQTLVEWTGVPREKILGKRLVEFFLEFDQKRYDCLLKTTFDIGSPAILSSHFHPHFIPSRKPNGQKRIQETVIRSIREDGEDVHRALVVVKDVTEEICRLSEFKKLSIDLESRVKSRTGEVEKSKESLSNLIKNLNGMVYHCRNDKDWTMDFVSAGCLSLTGYRPEDIEKSNKISFSELIHPDDREIVWGEVQKALNIKQSFVLNYRIRTSEGEVKYVLEQGRGVWLENGELDGLQGFITDVSELRRKTLELEKSERKFKSYFEMPLSGVAIFDTQCRWVEVNDRMCEIVGYSREELLGFTWMDVTYHDDMGSCTNLINEMKNKKIEKYTVEKRYIGKNGNIIPVEVFVGCVRDREGDPEYYVALVQDISERKKVEAEKELLSQMKTEFLSTAAHELRTPLTLIRGFSELMKTKDNLSMDTVKKYSKSINDESGTLANIINDLLDISKIEARKSFALTMTLSNLNNFVNEEVGLLNNGNSEHEFPVEILGDPCDVLMDSERVQQILRNLYSNSIKYSEKGCEISTKIEYKEDVVLVSVSDTGKGMTSDQVERIFDKFYRAEEVNNIQGTGLGMSIVKHLVEAHTGRVWVESETDKGTTVCFELPKFSPVWRSEFSVKVPSIDNQHKELFALTGKLAKSIRNNEGEESISLILNELVKYAEFHFKYEEDFFHKYNYPDTENHIKFHRSFEDTISGFKFISESDKQHLPIRVVSYLYNWLTTHILKEDMGYSSFLMSKRKIG